MRGVFEPGTYQARDTGRDETHELTFEPPRSLRGLEEVFVAHELHPNDEVILTITEDGLELEVDKRPRKKGSAVKGEPWESVSGPKASARREPGGLPGVRPPTAEAHDERAAGAELGASDPTRSSFEAVPAHLQREPVRGRPRGDRPHEEPPPLAPPDADDADAPRMVRARRIAPRQPGERGGPGAEDATRGQAERGSAPASSSLRPSAARRFYEDPNEPAEPHAAEPLPEDAWRWERPERAEEPDFGESSRQQGGFFARIAEAARGALNLRGGGSRGEPYDAGEEYSDEEYSDADFGQPYDTDARDPAGRYRGAYEAQDPYDAFDAVERGDVPPAADRVVDDEPRWVQTEQDDMIAQEPAPRRPSPTREPPRQDPRRAAPPRGERPDEARSGEQRPIEQGSIEQRSAGPSREEPHREEPPRQEPPRGGSRGGEETLRAQEPARRPYPQDIRRAAEAQREAEAKRAAEGSRGDPEKGRDRPSARSEPREAPGQRAAPRQGPEPRPGPGPSGGPQQAPAASAPRDVVVEDPGAEALDRQGPAMWDLGEGDLRSRLIRFLQHPDVPVILRTEMVARNFGLGEEVANAMLEDLTHDKIDNLVVTKVRDDTYRISRNPTQT